MRTEVETADGTGDSVEAAMPQQPSEGDEVQAFMAEPPQSEVQGQQSEEPGEQQDEEVAGQQEAVANFGVEDLEAEVREIGDGVPSAPASPPGSPLFSFSSPRSPPSISFVSPPPTPPEDKDTPADAPASDQVEAFAERQSGGASEDSGAGLGLGEGAPAGEAAPAANDNAGLGAQPISTPIPPVAPEQSVADVVETATRMKKGLTGWRAARSRGSASMTKDFAKLPASGLKWEEVQKDQLLKDAIKIENEELATALTTLGLKWEEISKGEWAEMEKLNPPEVLNDQLADKLTLTTDLTKVRWPFLLGSSIAFL